MGTLTLVLLLSATDPGTPPGSAGAEPAPVVSVARVRAMSGAARAILSEAVTRSPTIAHLIAVLQDERAFVFVDTRLDAAVPTGQTSLLTATSAGRYIHVVINPALSIDRRIELLGHELQHALEIAGADDVRDAQSFRHHFTEIGRAVGASTVREAAYETDAAQDVERQVRRDLTARIRDAI